VDRVSVIPYTKNIIKTKVSFIFIPIMGSLKFIYYGFNFNNAIIVNLSLETGIFTWTYSEQYFGLK